MSRMAFQPGPFEKVSAYDTPSVLLEQVINGHMAVGDTLTNTWALSPQERLTLGSRMKAAAGSNRLTKTLIDVATNPWAWFFFATSPAGASAMGRTGRIFSPSKSFNSLVRKEASTIGALGFMSPETEFAGMPTHAVVNGIVTGMSKMSREQAAIMGSAYERAMPLLGVERAKLTGADAASFRDASHRANVEKTLYAIQGSLDGWHKEQTFELPTKLLLDANKLPRSIEGWVQETRPAWTPNVDFDAVLRQQARILGGQGDEFVALRDKLRDAFTQRKVKLFGDEAAYAKDGSFAVDPKKVTQLFEGLSSRRLAWGTSIKDDEIHGEASALLRGILGTTVEKGIAEGKMNPDEFYGLVKRLFESSLPGDYFPRNILHTFNQEGVPIPLDELQRMGTIGAMKSTPRIIARTSVAGRYYHEDLQKISKYFGETPALNESIKASQSLFEEKKGNINFLRIDPIEGAHRYFNDTARSWAWHVQPLSTDVIEAQKVMAAELKPEDVPTNDNLRYFDTQKKIGVESVMEGAPEAHLRRNWTYADAMWQSAVLTKDPHTKRVIVDAVIPRINGKMGVRDAVLVQSYQAAKKTAGWFADTAVGKAIEATGPVGERFVGGLKEFSDPTRGLPSEGTLASKVANFLYVSHLGLNAGSVIMNSMQPALIGVPALGLSGVAKAYTSAFKDVGAYMKERGQIAKAIPEAVRQKTIRSTMRFSDVDGEDLLGIVGNSGETLDSITFHGKRPYEVQGAVGRIMEASLKPFEKVEWLNRSVTAHMVEGLYEKTHGVTLETASPKIRAAMKQDIRLMNSQTQFGGGPMSTPLFMQPGLPSGIAVGSGLFGHPLLRQFQQFGFRQMMSPFMTGGLIGGGNRYFRWGSKWPGPAWAFDFMRGMGFSAILYEVGKDMLGADLSRSLYWDSTTQIPLGVLNRDETRWPIPPAVEIPVNAVKALTTEDAQLWGETLSRLVPFGVSARRILGTAPFLNLPEWSKSPLAFGFGNIQKTHVGWDTPMPDGRVPVFDDAGSLIGAKSPASIVLKGLGADLGQWQNESELDNYLIQQRDEIVKHRQEYMRLLLSNNLSSAKAVQSQFAKKFGFPLTVTKDQVKQAISLRETPRVERVLDRMPREVKPYYAGLVAQNAAGRLTVPPEEIVNQAAQAKRKGRFNAVALDPQTVAEIRRQVAQKKQGRAPDAKPGSIFDPFSL